MATPLSQIPLPDKGKTTCIHHKGRQLDLYCEKCQELVCLECLSSIHEIHPVCELSEITHQKEQDIRNHIDQTEKNYHDGQVTTSDGLGQPSSKQKRSGTTSDSLGQPSSKQQRSGTTSDSLGQPSSKQQRSGTTSDSLGLPFSKQQRSGIKAKKAVTSYKLLPKPKVVEEWKSLCCIDSMCPTTDGQVWTKCSRTFTLLDRKGNIIQEAHHNSTINDISLSPTTHTLWVCDDKNNITELVSGRLTHRFSTKEEPRCICITASNHVIVGKTKHISKFTTDGKLVCTTMATGTGKPLVCTPWRISECPVTHNVAVADFSRESDGGDEKPSVVVMDTDFNELFVHRGDISSTYKPTSQTGGRSFNPYCVVYDSVGNLIIGDYDKDKFLVISGSGEFLRAIYTKTDCTWVVGIEREDVLWAVFASLESGYNVKLLQYSSL